MMTVMMGATEETSGFSKFFVKFLPRKGTKEFEQGWFKVLTQHCHPEYEVDGGQKQTF